MSERSERVRILTRITVIISISLLLVTAGSASCHDDRSPLISTLFPHPFSAPFVAPSHGMGSNWKRNVSGTDRNEPDRVKEPVVNGKGVRP